MIDTFKIYFVPEICVIDSEYMWFQMIGILINIFSIIKYPDFPISMQLLLSIFSLP